MSFSWLEQHTSSPAVVPFLVLLVALFYEFLSKSKREVLKFVTVVVIVVTKSTFIVVVVAVLCCHILCIERESEKPEKGVANVSRSIHAPQRKPQDHAIFLVPPPYAIISPISKSILSQFAQHTLIIGTHTP